MKHLMLMLITTLTLSFSAACGSVAPVDEPAVAQAEANAAALAASETNSADETDSAIEANEVVTLKIFLPQFEGVEEEYQLPLEQFEAETGARAELITPYIETIEHLEAMRQALNAGSSEFDVYHIDVIWPRMVGEHALNLNDYLPPSAIETFSPNIVADYSVGDKLVALPEFVNAGLLYYRADLLEKYGFTAPPATWDELEEMAMIIQVGERSAGQDEFWGYVWQGGNYEGLTCNALEWQVSHGGGQIIELDGTISVNNPQTVAALGRAASWVGTISPPDVTTYDEGQTIATWKNGNAAFMRQWHWFWDPDVRQNITEGRIGVTVLPSGGSQRAATLGGWAWMASRYSNHPELAAKLVQILTGPEAQKWRLGFGYPPATLELYRDPSVLATDPYLEGLDSVVINAVPRPSTVTGEQYAEVSAAYYNTVHNILTGKVTAAEGVAQLEAELVDITGFAAK